jgi:hypothetical protein
MDRENDFAEIREAMKTDPYLAAAYAHGIIHGALATILGAIVLGVLGALYPERPAR